MVVEDVSVALQVVDEARQRDVVGDDEILGRGALFENRRQGGRRLVDASKLGSILPTKIQFTATSDVATIVSAIDSRPRTARNIAAIPPAIAMAPTAPDPDSV